MSHADVSPDVRPCPVCARVWIAIAEVDVCTRCSIGRRRTVAGAITATVNTTSPTEAAA